MTKKHLAVTDQEATEPADNTDGPVFVPMTKEEILAETAGFDMPRKDDDKTMTHSTAPVFAETFLMAY